MLSEEQKRQKIKKIIYTVQNFLNSDYESLGDLAKDIGISSSSIQRYLHEKEIIESIFGQEVYELVQEKLSFSKAQGLQKGGLNSALKNKYSKDEKGRFTGSRRR